MELAENTSSSLSLGFNLLQYRQSLRLTSRFMSWRVAVVVIGQAYYFKIALDGDFNYRVRKSDSRSTPP